MKKTTIFVFSGPGGAGKTTLVVRLFRRKIIRENFLRGISCTTRPRRPGEEEAKDYFFLSKEEFLGRRRQNFFLESEKVLKYYYGTPRHFYSRAKKENKGLILCIDVKGGVYLKKNLKQAKIVTVFISAPTKKDLYERLTNRAEERSRIKQRIQLAKKELQFSKYYDYLVINQSLGPTLAVLQDILLKETGLSAKKKVHSNRN